MNISQNIRKIRENKSLSQKEVAITMGIAPTQYSRLENSKANPTVDTLVKIAQALDVSVDSIINGEDDPLNEVNIKDKSLIEKVKMINTLPEEEKNVVQKVIELAISKKNFKDFFQQQLTQ